MAEIISLKERSDFTEKLAWLLLQAADGDRDLVDRAIAYACNTGSASLQKVLTSIDILRHA